MKPTHYVARIVQQSEDACPLNPSEAEENPRIGLEEVAEESESEVGDHEEFEGVAGEEGVMVAVVILRLRRGFASRNPCSAQDDNFIKGWNQCEQEEDFVELGGMAGDAVPEVDGPGKVGGVAVGVVGETGKEATDASDSDAEG